jgi:hypothetical protein
MTTIFEMKSRDQVSVADIIGAWRLLLFEEESEQGALSYPYGKDAKGSLYYLADGHVSVHIMEAGRGPTIGKSLVLNKEIKYDQLPYLAYSGRYRLDGTTNRMIHEMEISLYPEWVGSQQVRVIELNGDQLKLSSQGPVGPQNIRFRLLWTRD